MIKNVIIEGLKYALNGVNELDQNIFENYKMREEVEGNVTTERNSYDNEGREGGCQECSSNNTENGSNVRRKDERNEGRQQEAEIGCNSTGRLQYRRDILVQSLTNDGKRFVNVILDGYYSEKANERDFENRYGVNEFPYPNLNLFRIVNATRRNYYNSEAEILGGTKSEYLVMYPEHKEYEDIEFELIDGEPEFMDPEEFERTWKRIVRVSPRINSDIQVNTKLTKPVSYWNDIKCAYSTLGMAVKYGETPTYDEYVLTKVLKPYWCDGFDRVTRIESKVPRITETDLMEWLFKQVGSNKDGNSNKSNNSNNSPKRNKWKGGKNKNNNNNNANSNNPNKDKAYQAEQSSDDKQQHDK